MVPLGMAVAGPVADIFGERIWFVVGGISVMVLGIAAFFTPTIMNVEEEATGKNQKAKRPIDECNHDGF